MKSKEEKEMKKMGEVRDRISKNWDNCKRVIYM